MKVGIVLDVWDPQRGGAERAVAKLVRHILADGHEAHVFTLRVAAGAPGEAHVLDRPVRPRGSMEIAFARAAVAAARDLECDVTIGIRHLEEIDVYWPHGGLHRETLACVESAYGGFRRGVSRTLHRMSLKHRAFLGLEQRLLAAGGARVVWCVSPMIRDELAGAYAACEPRLEVHRNGVDLDAFHPGLRDERRAAFLARHRVDPSSPVLVFPGGNWTLKGWDVMCDAMPRIAGPWTLVAAGAGFDTVTVPDALRDRVVVLPPQDARDLWGAADACVQPTWRDPCSLATLEALASGVSVVTTTANGARDAASQGGAVTPVGDAAGFAEAVTDVIAEVIAGRGPVLRQAARAAVADRAEVAWLAGLVASLARAGRTSLDGPPSP